jgi:hypothetical protein
MVSRTPTLDPGKQRRRCLACGYDGALLRNGEAPLCARCGCNLRLRPARSYVEMEGLIDGPGTRSGLTDPLQEARLIHRWIAFLFLACVSLIAIFSLAAAAFSV